MKLSKYVYDVSIFHRLDPQRHIQYFNNEMYQVQQYDKALVKYEKASVKIATSLAWLNTGQNVIFSSALTAMMYLAGRGVLEGVFGMSEHYGKGDFIE